MADSYHAVVLQKLGTGDALVSDKAYSLNGLISFLIASTCR